MIQNYNIGIEFPNCKMKKIKTVSAVLQSCNHRNILSSFLLFSHSPFLPFLLRPGGDKDLSAEAYAKADVVFISPDQAWHFDWIFIKSGKYQKQVK